MWFIVGLFVIYQCHSSSINEIDKPFENKMIIAKRGSEGAFNVPGDLM